MDIKTLNTMTKSLFSALDTKDGKQDKYIQKSVWNDFADLAGGKKIQYCINQERAELSIKSYLRHADDETLMKLANFAGLSLDLSTHEPSVSQKNEPGSTSAGNEQVIAPTPANPQKQTPEKNVSAPVSQPATNLPNFSNKTLNLFNKNFVHATTLLKTAQNNLGLYEITYSEYLQMKKNNPAELNNTQYRVIGNHGNITDAWCAHTVSYLSNQAGMDIGGHKATVQGFINWAGNDYKRISTKNMTENNYLSERENREIQIRKQLPDMNEGDFIIWKNNSSNNGSFIIVLEDGTLERNNSSHIGIIENIDLENGIVTVIEGNSNESAVGGNGERVLITRQDQASNGGQRIGDHEEVNRRDGLIRKQYTIEDLAIFGYSGYIDNSSRV